jgi:recombinational DNA repair ATPase RecF
VRITRLQARDIGRHRDLDIELAAGVTVVRGPNEAGKSTIQRIIELALTRKVTSANGDLDVIRAWDADEEGRPWVRLEFVAEDEDGGVRTGELEKSFRGPKGTVRLVIDGEVTTDPTEADLRIAELTGIPTEPFFRSTASVRHHELEQLARDEANLHDRLQASISGADRGTSAAKKKLERALKELTKSGDKNPGRLKVAQEAVTRSAALVDQGEAALTQLERDRDVLAGAKERRAVIGAKLAEDRALLEKARQAERLIAEQAQAQERFERFRTAVQVRDDIAALTTSHPSPNPLPVLNQVVVRLRGLGETIRDLTARLEGEGDVHFQVDAVEPTWRITAGLALLIVIVGLALAVGGFFADAAILLPVGAVLVLIGAVIAVLARRQRLTAQSLKRQKELAGDEIDRRLRGRSQMEEDLKQAQADFETQLTAVDLPDLAAGEALLAAEQAHVAKIEQMRAGLEGLVGRQPPETLPDLRDAAALEIDQKSGALEKLGPIAREPRARERLETVVRDSESALERSRDDEAGARARVEANTVDAEQVAGEAERLADWREQLAVLERRVRVYDATLASILRAEQATMRTATRFLEKRMVVDIARITGGRYRRVRVDDRTLGIEVFAPEKGDWVDVSTLSQGTLDQIYLAARLGLVRLVTGDRRPPLIFDDPFVTFDDARAARAVEMLHELNSDFQVIYLTTSERYDATADRVVVLEGPTATDAGADEAAATA